MTEALEKVILKKSSKSHVYNCLQRLALLTEEANQLN